MHTGTGNIISHDVFDEIRKTKPAVAKWYKEIPEEYLSQLQGMNRRERREFYRKYKKLFNKVTK